MPARRELRYQHTRILLVEGTPLDHPRQAVLVTVNARGVMASGFAGALRLAAGGDVERELRSHGTLLVGEAYPVGPGRLAGRGVERIVCAATTPRPGDAPRRVAVEEALASALSLLRSTPTRSLTLPEVGARIPGITFAEAAGILIAALTDHLRRGLALDEVVIAGTHLEYLRACRAALEASGATLVSAP